VLDDGDDEAAERLNDINAYGEHASPPQALYASRSPKRSFFCLRGWERIARGRL
jgi:hypothetical protein